MVYKIDHPDDPTEGPPDGQRLPAPIDAVPFEVLHQIGRYVVLSRTDSSKSEVLQVWDY